jgi:hypothetical protein
MNYVPLQYEPFKYEPLKSILDLTDNKQDSIVFFLNDEIKSKMNNYYYYDEKNKDIFINQLIICIKKCDLSLDIKGKIVYIKKNNIGITINNLYTKYIDMNLYYIFLKDKKSKSSDAEFFEHLLKNL